VDPSASQFFWEIWHAERFGMQNANPNEVYILPMLCRLSLDESILIYLLYINFKCAITVDCEPMPLKEEPLLHHIDGETSSFVNVGKVGCHKEVLVVLWCDTQSFR